MFLQDEANFDEMEMNALLENNQDVADDLDPNGHHHHSTANKNKHKKRHSAPSETGSGGDTVIVEFNLDTNNDTSVTKFLN